MGINEADVKKAASFFYENSYPLNFVDIVFSL